jgi:tetratricopeptide (TPR) repeat protein
MNNNKNYNNEDFSVGKVVIFEQMIKNKRPVFLETEDFEIIIDYYLEVELFEKALLASKTGLEQYPHNLELSILSSEILSVLGKHNEAINSLENTLIKYPSDTEILFCLGKQYSIINEYSIASKFFKAALSNSSENRNEMLNDLI